MAKPMTQDDDAISPAPGLAGRGLPSSRYWVGLGIVLLSGLTYGLCTGRWRDEGELSAAAARLDALELPRIGEWLPFPQTVDQWQFAQSGLTTHLARRYENARTGESVIVLVVCGRSRAASTLSPTACFTGAGYVMTAPPTRRELLLADGRTASLRMSNFFIQDRDGAVRRPRVYWAWNTSGAWHTPDYPRLAFPRYPYAFNINVIGEDEQGVVDDSCIEVMRSLLPFLDRRLFPPAARED